MSDVLGIYFVCVAVAGVLAWFDTEDHFGPSEFVHRLLTVAVLAVGGPLTLILYFFLGQFE